MRVLLVDDHPLMRVGVAHLVREEWPDAIVDEAATIAAALERIAAARPDLVVLDLSLPDASGLEGASRVLRLLPNVPLLVLSLNAEAAYAARLMQMGAGLGRTGETLIVGSDRLLRSASRLDSSSTILRQRISIDALARAFAGESGLAISPEKHADGSEVPVLVAFQPAFSKIRAR